MEESSVTQSDEESGQRNSNVHDKAVDTKKMINILKLIVVGFLLPAFDLVTDIFAIHQYWISPQWVFNYLAYALMISILMHNGVSFLYGWRHLSKFGKAEKDLCTLGKLCCYGLGIGNIQVAFEIIVSTVFTRNSGKR